MPTNVRDPRSIITPHAFGVSKALLGTPLAAPWRRFWAMCVDLLVVGLLTVFLDSIQLLVWGVVALVFIRVAFARKGRQGQAAAVLLRTSAGCLGVVILLAVVVAWLVGRGGPEGARTPGVPDVPGVAGVPGVDGVDDADDADDVDDVDAAAAGVRPEGAAASPDATDADPARVAAVRDEVEGMSVAEAMSAFAALLEPGVPPDTGLVGVRARELRRRLAGVVSADTLALLEDSLRTVSGRATRLRRDLRDTREALAEEQDSFTDLLRDVWEQLGSAIGLWSIYFTVLLTLWNGRTVGKRLMGVRVVRLDAEPMSWWYAFERAGGYVAGLATGLLGFVQVFWDPNRQCIHDKIVGTVVVVDGAGPLPGAWREASGLIEDEEDASPMNDR